DGTVMSAEMAMALPVMSFASGATNSMRGAAFLSGMQDAMVVDVGGTSSDVGQLRRGFPREANSVVEIGEVRTLFRMPDLFSIGLGGGSIVSEKPLAVGPRSVGYRLTEAALVFGGTTLTATDAAAAAGVVEIGVAKNAVGAAIAQISGETDQVYRDMIREDAIAAAEAQAVERAVAAGAERGTLQTVDVEDMPLAYLPGNALRVRVRVAGEMQRPT